MSEKSDTADRSAHDVSGPAAGSYSWIVSYLVEGGRLGSLNCFALNWDGFAPGYSPFSAAGRILGPLTFSCQCTKFFRPQYFVLPGHNVIRPARQIINKQSHRKVRIKNGN